MASLLTTFLAALILAYVLKPLSKSLQSLRLGIRLSAILTLILGIFLIFGVILLFSCVLQKELPTLAQQLPIWLRQSETHLSPLLSQLPIKLDWAEIQKIAQDRILQQIDMHANTLISSGINTIFSSGQSILATIFNAVLIIFIVFYLIAQWDDFFEKIQNLVPPRWKSLVLQIFKDIDLLLSQYLRGQLLVIAILATYYSIGLSALGLTGGLALGLFTGLAIFIPYLGFITALVLALISATLQIDSGISIISILLLYLVGQVLESFVLTPKLVGERIGLHPVLVVSALILFGDLFGFFGVLLALPMSAVSLVLSRHAMACYKASSWYRQ
jgi:predicted PurR-regulated permease PerM